MRNEFCLKKEKKKKKLCLNRRIANFRSFAQLQAGLSRATLWVETHGHNCQGEFLNYTTRVESINVTLEAEQQQDGTDIKTTRQVSSSRTNKGHCHEKSERKVSKRMETFMFCFCFCFVKRNEGAARHADRYKSLKKMQSEETQ